MNPRSGLSRRRGLTRRLTITLQVEGEWEGLEKLVAEESERNVSAIIGRLIVKAAKNRERARAEKAERALAKPETPRRKAKTDGRM